MSMAASILPLLLLLFLVGIFAGSETGFYSLSRVRIDAEAEEGRPFARLIRFLLRGEAGLLITLLIGTNLGLEVLTHLAEGRLGGWGGIPPWGREVAVTLVLTPLVFFFAELLPKDLFHRRPHQLVAVVSPLVALARLVFLPLALPLRLLSVSLERLLGIESRDLTRALGRERVLEVLQEGTSTGVLSPRGRELALRVFDLRATRVGSVLVPWQRVEHLDLDADEGEGRSRIASSAHSRLPAVRRGEEGGREVVGYVLQLDHLAAVGPGPAVGERVADLLRPLVALPEDLPVDRALARMRLAGQRIALVGTPGEPRGIVTLKDLVQTISGDLGGW